MQKFDIPSLRSILLKSLYIISIFMLVILGISFFNFFYGRPDLKNVATVNKIINGVCVVGIEMPSGRSVLFVDPRNHPKPYNQLLNELSDNGLVNEKIILKIRNDGAEEFYVGVEGGGRFVLEPGQIAVRYSGTLGELLNEHIGFDDFKRNKIQCTFSFEFEGFRGKTLNLRVSIPIIVEHIY
jgi:hypothetical protein